jgi:uncharacterized membrane protein YhhN
MYLRDYFAAHIISGMIAAATSFRSETPENVASVAYMLADAMMKHRTFATPMQPEAKPASTE